MDSSAEDLVARYASRWGIEQASADARQIMGSVRPAIGHATVERGVLVPGQTVQSVKADVAAVADAASTS